MLPKKGPWWEPYWSGNFSMYLLNTFFRKQSNLMCNLIWCRRSSSCSCVSCSVRNIIIGKTHRVLQHAQLWGGRLRVPLPAWRARTRGSSWKIAAVYHRDESPTVKRRSESFMRIRESGNWEGIKLSWEKKTCKFTRLILKMFNTVA